MRPGQPIALLRQASGEGAGLAGAGQSEATDGKLSENIAYFGRALRAAGLPVGPGAVLDAISAVAAARIGTRQDFFWTLHAVFVKRHEHSVLFEQAFRIFWRRRSLLEKLIAQMSPIAPGAKAEEKPKPGALRVAEALAPQRQKTPEKKEESEFSARLTVSDREVLKAKDFAQMTAEEIAKAKHLIADLHLPDDERVTRRFVADPAAGASICAAPSGGRCVAAAPSSTSPIARPRRATPRSSPSSTSPGRWPSIRGSSCTSCTRLRKSEGASIPSSSRQGFTNISRELTSRDPDEALARASARAQDWEGGTRIAHALHDFNRLWSRRVLGQGAVVLLFTDGLERHVTDELTFEMDRLKRSCRRLVWLNPLLRFDGFEARASGIRAMLPHVHEFRPIHNLASMADLCSVLSDKRVVPSVIPGPRSGARNL